MPEANRPPGVEALLRQRQRPDVAAGAITTYGNKTLAEISLDDVLNVNWEAVKGALREAIARIQQEGELESSDVADAVLLVTVALRDLAQEQESVRVRLATLPETNWFHYILAVLPNKLGEQVRKMIADRAPHKKKEKRLDTLVGDVTELRTALAGVIDERLHNKLLYENEDYRKLVQQRDTVSKDLIPAQTILTKINDVIAIGKRSFVDGMDSWVAFYEEYGCKPVLQVRSNYNRNPEELLAGIQTFVEQMQGQYKMIIRQMRHMRDEEKGKIYAQHR